MERSERQHVAWLYTQLPKLVSEGTLTQSQADDLRRKYGVVEKTSSMPIFVAVFGILGALLIGGGIILLIAHNWDEMSKPARLVFSFLPLLIMQILGLWVWFRKPDSDVWKESVAALQALMIGASIALVSQTYNIGGDPPSFILTWMLLGLPLVYIFSSTITAILYLAASSSWVMSVWNWWWWHENPYRRLMFWVWVALIIPYVIIRYSRPVLLKRDHLLGWVLGIALLISLGMVHPNFCYITYPCLLCIYYFASKFSATLYPERQRGPFYWLGGFGIFAMTVAGGFKDFWPTEYHHNIGEFERVPQDVVVAAILVLFLVGLVISFIKSRAKCEYAMIVLPVLGYVSELWRPYPMNMAILTNVFALVWGVWLLRRAFTTERMDLLNAGVMLICAMIISRFFDSQMDFVGRAIGFIVVGCGFLGANWYMLHLRKERKATA